jgi:type II secretory pathway pseudopilin PulG
MAMTFSTHRRNFSEDIMNVRGAGERGMSLVEATIILMVLAVLTSVIAPSLSDYVEDSRQVKAKEDVEAIGTGIARMVRDTGLGCLSDTPASFCTKATRVDLLISNGNDTLTTAAADYAAPGGTDSAAVANNNWIGGTTPVGSNNQDTIDNQLVKNTPVGGGAYTLVSFTLGGGPRQGVGWRGAYITGPVGPDPWGYKYQSNTMFLLPASDAAAGTTNGLLNGGWINDVIVVSAGPDGVIQTPFGNNTSGGTSPTGDDVLYVVTGSSR